ncbi:VWA domain-containing protein [Cellulomonas chitinilytica]|uniref:VWA domain-containing protein n=1 Tax=Cellulomonas chitinilytica TaxID=398759 RepID=UPI001943C69B|nr:vWA domain-containing protein [Cellulomonas chitinilytica]
MTGLLEPNEARIGDLREPARLRRTRRVPLWAPLLVVALLAGGGRAAWEVIHRPERITDVALSGARSPVPLDVVLLLDESGSFAAYESVRAEAITQLTDWAPANLRADDTLTVVAFTDEAVVRMPTTTVGELAARGAPLSAARAPGAGTSILPALRTALGNVADTGHPRTVIAITDTMVGDADPDAAAEAAARLDAITMTTITPSGVAVTPGWRDAFPWAHHVDADADSAGSTSLAIAEALAHATGQRVVRR